MKVKEVIKYLETLPSNAKVVVTTLSEQEYREIYMIENDCRGKNLRVVIHPGRRTKKT